MTRRQDQAAARRNRHWGWALMIGALLAFAAVATKDRWWPGAGRDDFRALTAAQVARGADLFRQHCQPCHGEQAQGENPLAPQGGEKPGGGYLAPALNARGHAHHHPPDVLFGYLRNGSPAQDSPMRSFRDKLSEDDMRSVLGYVWSLWPERLQQAYVQAHNL